VAGKGQGDPRRHARKNIRFVREQNDRIVGRDLRERPRQIVNAAEAATADAISNLIADPGNPDPLASGPS
jgi:hypothetical protein